MAQQRTRQMSTVAFITMGCAKNEVDTAHMTARLANAGYRVIDDAQTADCIVVNTCSFIEAATEESIEAVLEASGYENVASEGAKLVVAGCMPARYGTDLENALDEGDAFLPCAKEDNVVEVIDRLLDVQPSVDEALLQHEVSVPFSSSPSAYVKISDGCNRFCSYCAIPYIRGRYHSFSFEEIDAEISRLVTSGTKEIVLIAQDTGRWGDDFDEPKTLAWLMDTLARTYPDTWLRVMYIQPEGITDELIDVIARHNNVCSYFDLPFQHVDSAILKAMNRHGSREEYEALINRIRVRIPEAIIRTTLIAGFPGETDEQFEDLCDFVETSDLDYIGVFAYSREEGTRAFSLEDQIDEDDKADRAQRLRDLADAVCIPRVAERIGTTMPVLVCGYEEDGQLFGRAQCQAPDVDGVTYLEQGDLGTICTVTITDTLLYEMEGE